MMGLLEVCSDKLLHSAFWLFARGPFCRTCRGAAAWERAIACARAAREEPGLGPEFGVITDPDFLLGNTLWAYADRLIEHGEFARAEPLLTESAKIFQARGSRFEMADSLGTTGAPGAAARRYDKGARAPA